MPATAVEKNLQPTPAIQKVLDETEMIWADKSFRTLSRKQILGPMPDLQEFEERSAKLLQKFREDEEKNDVIMLACYQKALLSQQQEQHLFRQYNFLKSLARNAVQHHNPSTASHYLKRAHKLRQYIALCNMRLAVKISKSIKLDLQDRKTMINEAYMVVVKIIDKFDWTRKVSNVNGKCNGKCKGACTCKFEVKKGKKHRVKFSTYASWALQKSLWVFCRKECRKQYVCVGITADDLGLEKTPAPDQGYDDEVQHLKNKKFLTRLLRFATEREQQVLILRHGLAKGSEPMTLKEVGEAIGVSKERIRQLEARGLRQIQNAVQRRGIQYAA
jgi:RNA polymerase sigma factor (sigma-70 family)